ncbi:LexA family transcriptional regulator [Neokomagataea anthophila]|uniref:LexA family transcriptional regulator n=1 Tax=Neokomagataea anthophila TaxID=2826925 RepID=A0ABS5E6J5_9PROT|nr:XRE family transcriptional regulator [Neokomagataea anthophila]MBR0559533.1 LexA family transcriptional regulator [Neokomagataea anthophila]
MNCEAEMRTERLKQAIKAAGGNDTVAARAGIGTTTVSGYQNGKEWKLANVEKLASACNVSLQWLLFGDVGGMRENTLDANPNIPKVNNNDASISGAVKTIPGYNIEMSAGYGFLPDTSIEEVSFSLSTSAFPPELLLPNRKLIGVRAKGDSMEPYICSGDVIVLDLNDKELFTGGVFALRIGEQLLVKRLIVKINGNISVVSDNPRYPAEELSAAELRQMSEDSGSPMSIIGRVVWRMGMTIS